jgi:hypothetical protein
MDLTPLIEESGKPVEEFVLGYIDRFRADVQKRIHSAL